MTDGDHLIAGTYTDELKKEEHEEEWQLDVAGTYTGELKKEEHEEEWQLDVAGSCTDELKKEEYEERQLDDETGGFGTLDVKVQKEEPESLYGSGVKDEEVKTPAKRRKAAPEECVGLSFENLFPKEAVRQFCDRYKGGRSTKADFFYQHEHTESGVVATLVTPLLKNREFRGYEAANEKEAERSAAEAFTADTEVLEIAERLPPPFSHFTKRAKNSRRKQDDMLAQGLPGGKKGIVQQIAHDRYMGLREQGARTAVWDGNA
ncbi:unnamed protein product [Symbiodinium microadriaticum]|nr:unnamed protein product [Symbiodinium microadriaticum]CAE7943506.1 unnamed protein product [Symbiodinium sp. KB8]